MPIIYVNKKILKVLLLKSFFIPVININSEWWYLRDVGEEKTQFQVLVSMDVDEQSRE